MTRAEEFFRQAKQRSSSMYATMIKGKTLAKYAVSNHFRLGYTRHQMAQKGVDLCAAIDQPSEVLVIAIFNACAQLRTEQALNIAQSVFQAMPSSYANNPFIFNCAFDTFIKCGDLVNAELVFKKMKRSVIGYGRLMQLYNLARTPDRTLTLYEQLKREPIRIDRVIYLLIIGACSQIALQPTCERIAQEIPRDLLADDRIASALINMWVRSIGVCQWHWYCHSRRAKRVTLIKQALYSIDWLKPTASLGIP